MKFGQSKIFDRAIQCAGRGALLIITASALCYAEATKAPKATKAEPSLTGAISSTVLQQPDDGGDYIPCKFTVAQLDSLSNPEIANVLTSADVESLISRVIGTVRSQSKTKSDPFLDRFALNLTAARNDLVGKTPSEILNTILTIVAKSKSELMQRATADDLSELSGHLKLLAPEDAGVISDVFRGVQALTPTRMNLYSDALAGFEKTGNTNPVIKNALETGDGLTDTNAIVDAAQKSIASLIRPTDVGCAMSILSFGETSKAYGRVIANEYIAIQVHVRNLNRTQEFVLHDAQFAVNADPGGRLGRYFSGRDKVIVRSLSAAQQTLDPRNIIVHSVQGVGTILSAVSPIFNGAVGLATGVYNGAFATSLDKYWKDQSADQLNLLNDTGFSSSMNSQTVVPKGGSSLIVIFVPEKPFTQGWWLLPCTGYIPIGTINGASGAQPNARTVAPHTSTGGAGVDIAKALEVCTDSILHGKDGTKVELTGGSEDLFASTLTTPYKKWSGNSLQIFAELSNVVVAGMHIVSDDQLQPSLTQLDCTPKDASGNLTFDPPLKDTITCAAKGKNLDKFAKVRLRNAGDLSDAATAEGPLTVTGDSTSATASFQTTTLLGLDQPSYSVFGVSTNGVEQPTGQFVHLSLNPVVTGYIPSPLDFTASPAPTSLTLNGFHLGNVTSVVLSDQSNHKVTLNKLAPTAQTETSVSFTVDSTSFQGVSGSMTVVVSTSDNKTATVTSLQVTGPK